MTTTIDRSACPARRHGRYWARNRYRCTCPDAIAELRARRRARTEGRLAPGYLNPTGTSRRLRALAVEGWTLDQLAEHTGLAVRTLLHALHAAQRVQPATARAVAAVYRRLAGYGGPSRIAAARARARGWHDSYAWHGTDIDQPDARPLGLTTDPHLVDPVAVDRALAGDPDIRLTRAERRAAARIALGRGLSVTATAELLGTSNHTVRRYTEETTAA